MFVNIGVDIGQKRDPTAICVAEKSSRHVEGRAEEHFIVRHLERLQLGTPYPEAAQRVGEIIDQLQPKVRGSLILLVDATGVGKPIVDLVGEQASGISLVAVYFTHGDRCESKWVDGHRQLSLGKAYVVARLQILLQRHRLHLPKTHEVEALAEELLKYEIRVDENANEKYGAFRVGTHDDLVTALGLAVQTEKVQMTYRVHARAPWW